MYCLDKLQFKSLSNELVHQNLAVYLVKGPSEVDEEYILLTATSYWSFVSSIYRAQAQRFLHDPKEIYQVLKSGAFISKTTLRGLDEIQPIYL